MAVCHTQRCLTLPGREQVWKETPLEYTTALISAVVAEFGVISALAVYIKQCRTSQAEREDVLIKSHMEREDRIHEQCRLERESDKQELQRTRGEFTQTLLAIAGVGKEPSRPDGA